MAITAWLALALCAARCWRVLRGRAVRGDGRRIETEGGSGSVAAADGWLGITDHDHSAVHRLPWSSW